MSVSDSVKKLNRIGAGLAGKLERLEIRTIRDLLFHFPSRYENYSEISRIKDLYQEPKTHATIYAVVELISNRRSRKSRIMITEAVLFDGEERVKAVWFNQPFISKQLPQGFEFYFSGKIKNQFSNLSLVNPLFEPRKKEGGQIHTASRVPVYPVTEGISQKQIRFLTKRALAFADEVKEWMPEFFLKQRNYLSLPEALKEIHYPQTGESLSKARGRLAYEEVFEAQSGICYLKKSRDGNSAPQIGFLEQETRDWVKNLPFKLTEDQKKVSWRILKDLSRDRPMNRLVQGDVGSGKTVVAFMAAYNTVLNGFQCALMAPTEILARQHFENAIELFGNRFDILLLTAADKRLYGESGLEKIKGDRAMEYLTGAEAVLVIGTHSMIRDSVCFSNLGLVIVDEQHRFGVKQRGILRESLTQDGKSPHYLSMSATPIPRTQALFIYGDLDISIIRRMPEGRKPVITKVVEEHQKQAVYDFIENQIQEGKQVFVICPLIEASDSLGARSVEETYAYLKENVFANHETRMLHGKLRTKEKDAIMKAFQNNAFPILISTSVVEVGVDIPNANIMMIEGAERFGLAQLHQFRGRVGRGGGQAYCYLFAGDPSRDWARLRLMETIHDGLVLAQKDMRIRGSGQVFGEKQSGIMEFRCAPNAGDPEWIRLVEQVREDIFIFLDAHEKNGDYADIFERMKKKVKGIYLE